MSMPPLERTTSGSTLTAHGTILVHWARETLTAATQFLTVADALRGERDAELTVAASLTVAEHLMPRWLGEFRAGHPDTTVHLQVQNSADVLDALSTGACAVGFVESPTIPTGATASCRPAALFMKPATCPPPSRSCAS